MNFASDNTAPVSPEILAALSAANEGSVGSYGADGWTERMRAELRAVYAHDQLADGEKIRLVADGVRLPEQFLE